MSARRNLTRTMAAERAALLDVLSYDIELDLTDGAGRPSEGTFSSRTTIRFDCARPGAATEVDLAAATLVEATLNGVAVSPRAGSAGGGLSLPGLAATNELRVVARMDYVGGGRGMHRSVDPADGQVYLYTSFEPASAQCVFACFDQPDLKSTFRWRVRVPAGWRVVSNLPASAQEPDPTGAVTVHFPTSPRMSTYITAICAGPYAEVRSRTGARDLGVFCRPSLLAHLDAEEIFDLTRRGMDFFEAQFGQPYPLPKYDHVAAPDYRGAMENFGCIVFNERMLVFRSKPTESDRRARAMVILHELAHMWFGDLVTMRWWDDLWLNEAFATWASFWCLAEATSQPNPWAAFAVQQKTAGIKADQLSSTHPVYADIPDIDATETNFDAITYRKGASVLKQLTAYVGIDAFTTALRAYFATHAWGNATFDDLIDALVAASGRPVREFATQWLRTSWPNTLRASPRVDTEGRYERVEVRQEAPAAHPTLRTHRIALGLYDLTAAGLCRRDRIEVEVAGERTEVAALRGVAAADVLLVNDDDLTFAKVRLDDGSLATVREHIHRFGSQLPRAICWASVADMVNDAELAARDLVALARTGLAGESDAAVVTSVLGEVARAVDFFADPAWAAAGWASVADLAGDAISAAQPGSPLQLTWVRAFASAARAGAHLTKLREWYAGTDLPEGLKLDVDLRWLMLQGLVAAGASGAEEIEREAAADRSVSGRSHAALAHALIPTEAAKRRAWQIAAAGVDEPVEVRLASLVGYGHPGHTALTGSHVSTYLSTVDDIWHRQGNEIGQYFATQAFPAAHVSAQTVAAIQAWRDAGEHPPALVRLVSDGLDHMVRALRGRARDSAAAASAGTAIPPEAAASPAAAGG